MGYLFVRILTGLTDVVGCCPCENRESPCCEVFAFPAGTNLGMTHPLKKGLLFPGSSMMGV